MHSETELQISVAVRNLVSISVEMMDKIRIYSVILKLKIKVYSCSLRSINLRSTSACPFRKKN